MSYCSVYNESNAHVQALSKILSSEDAIWVLTQNNGYPLNLDKDGDASEAWDTLLEEYGGDEVQTSIAIARLYRSNPEVLLTKREKERLKVKREAREDGTFMVAPDGNATILNEDQWITARTEGFKEWFGDWETSPNPNVQSLTANGEPAVENGMFCRDKVSRKPEDFKIANSTDGRYGDRDSGTRFQLAGVSPVASDSTTVGKLQPMLKKLTSLFGDRVKVQIVTDSKALEKALKKESLIVRDGKISGAVYGNTVYLVADSLTEDTAFHEFCHILFNYAQQSSNESLRATVMKVASEAPASIKQYVEKNYPNASEDEYLDECFAWAMCLANKENIHDFLSKRGIEEGSTEETEVLAWYQRLWRAVKDLFNKFHTSSKSMDPKDLLAGYTTWSQEQAAQKLFDLMVSGTTLEPLAKASEQELRYSLIGLAGAQNIDLAQAGILHALDRAKQMEAAGEDPLLIKKSTRWERVHGVWKAEITGIVDSEEALKERLEQFYGSADIYKDIPLEWMHGNGMEQLDLIKKLTMNEFKFGLRKTSSPYGFPIAAFVSPALLAAYPDLNDVNLILYKDKNPWIAGYQNYSSKEIGLNFDYADKVNHDFIATLEHEVQHFIQERELSNGFATGSNSSRAENFLRASLIRNATDFNPSGDLQEGMREASYNLYARVLGEAEARAVSRRYKMAKSVRRITLAQDTLDSEVSPEDVVIDNTTYRIPEDSWNADRRLHKAMLWDERNRWIYALKHHAAANGDIQTHFYTSTSTDNPRRARANGYVDSSGAIWLNADLMTIETPIHEYTHLWAKSMMINNPNGWASIKRLIVGTDLWQAVKNDPDYRDIKDDEDLLVSEALARFSGKQGAKRLEEIYRQNPWTNDHTGEIKNWKDAVQILWNWVADLFHIDTFRSVEDVADRVLYDLLNDTPLNLADVDTRSTTIFYSTLDVDVTPKSGVYDVGSRDTNVGRSFTMKISEDAICPDVLKFLLTGGSKKVEEQLRKTGYSVDAILKEIFGEGRYSKTAAQVAIGTLLDMIGRNHQAASAYDVQRYLGELDYSSSTWGTYSEDARNQERVDMAIMVYKRLMARRLSTVDDQYSFEGYAKDINLHEGEYKELGFNASTPITISGLLVGSPSGVRTRIGGDFQSLKHLMLFAKQTYLGLETIKTGADVGKEAIDTAWSELGRQDSKGFENSEYKNIIAAYLMVNPDFKELLLQSGVARINDTSDGDEKYAQALTDLRAQIAAQESRILTPQAMGSIKGKNHTFVYNASNNPLGQNIGEHLKAVGLKPMAIGTWAKQNKDNILEGTTAKDAVIGQASVVILFGSDTPELTVDDKNKEVLINPTATEIQRVLLRLPKDSTIFIDNSYIKKGSEEFNAITNTVVSSVCQVQDGSKKPEILNYEGASTRKYTPKVVNHYKYSDIADEQVKFTYDVLRYGLMSEFGYAANSSEVQAVLEAFLEGDETVFNQYVLPYLKGYYKLQRQLENKGCHINTDQFGYPHKDGTGHYDISGAFGGLNITLDLYAQENEFRQAINDEALIHTGVSTRYSPAEIVAPNFYKIEERWKSLSSLSESAFKAKLRNSVQAHYESQFTSMPLEEGQERPKLDMHVRCHHRSYNIVFTYDRLSDTAEFGDQVRNIPIDDEGNRLDGSGHQMYKLPQSNSEKKFEHDNIIVRQKRFKAGTEETIVIKIDDNYSMDKAIADLDIMFGSDNSLVSIQPFMQNVQSIDEANKLLDTAVIPYAYVLDFQDELNSLDRSSIENLRTGCTVMNTRVKKAYNNAYMNQMWKAFQQAHHVVSTRLPSQALASIQDAVIVEYLNSNINNAFVTRWQLWLQGSDLDIDKTFLLGYHTDGMGCMIHWSPLKDFSSVLLTDLSLRIPLPNGKPLVTEGKAYLAKGKDAQIVTSTPHTSNSADISEEVALYKRVVSGEQVNLDIYSGNQKEQQKLNKLTLIIRALEKIQDAYEVVISPELISDPVCQEFLNTINRHNTHRISDREIQNFTTANIHNVIGSSELDIESHTSIDGVLKPFSDALAEIPEENEDADFDKNSGDLFWILNLANYIGKKDVGVAANGLKAMFGMSQCFNKYFTKKEPLQTTDCEYFNVTLTLPTLKRDFANPIAKENFSRVRKTFSCIADSTITPQNRRRLEELNRQKIAEDKKAGRDPGSDLVFSRDNCSDVLSALLTLAVDNAKTLSLGKMNASMNLMCCHIALAILGYSPEEIVNVTTSEAFKTVAKAAAKQFSFTGSILDPNLDHAFFTKVKLRSDESMRYDIDQIEKLFNIGQEVTQLALLYGINQGVAANEENIIKMFDRVNNAYRTITSRINLSKKFVTGSDGVIKAKPGAFSNGRIDYLLRELRLTEDSVLGVDVARYFEDASYRELITLLMNEGKVAFNVFDIFNKSRNYFEMYRGFAKMFKMVTTQNSRQKYIWTDAKRMFTENMPNLDDAKHLPSKKASSSPDEDIDAQLEMALASDGQVSSQASRLYRKRTAFDNTVRARLKKLYKQKIFCDLLKQEAGRLKTKMVIPLGKSKLPVPIDLSSNDGIPTFIQAMNLAFVSLQTKDEFKDNTFLQMLTPLTKRYGVLENLPDIYVLSQSIGQLRSDDGNSAVLTKLEHDYAALANRSLESLLGKGNSNITFGDFLMIYDQLIQYVYDGDGTSFEHLVFKDLKMDGQSMPSKLIQMYKLYDSPTANMDIPANVMLAYVNRDLIIASSSKAGLTPIARFMDGSTIDLSTRFLMFMDNKSHDVYSQLALLQLRKKIAEGKISNLRYSPSKHKFLFDISDGGSTRLVEVSRLPEVKHELVEQSTYEGGKQKQEMVDKVTPKFYSKITSTEQLLREFVAAIKQDAKAREILVGEVLDNTPVVEQIENAQNNYTHNIRSRKNIVLGTKQSVTITEADVIASSSVVDRLAQYGVEVAIVSPQEISQISGLPADQVNSFVHEGKIYIKSSSDSSKLAHELTHIIMAVFKASNYSGYSKFMHDMAENPVIKEILTNQVSVNPVYANMMFNDRVEEALMRFLESTLTEDGLEALEKSKENLDLDRGGILFQIEDTLSPYVQEAFALKSIPSFFSFIKTSIVDLPRTYNSTLWNFPVIRQNGYLEHKMDIQNMSKASNYIKSLLSDRDAAGNKVQPALTEKCY